jgi:hypothetical protein
MDWVVGRLPSIYKALGSIPSISKTKKYFHPLHLVSDASLISCVYLHQIYSHLLPTHSSHLF